MFAPRIDFTYVHLPQPWSERFEDKIGLRHCCIYLAGMAQVEAETGLWQSFEHLLDLIDSACDRFSLVHVLDTEPAFECLPQRVVTNGIRVRDDRPFPRRKFQETGHDIPLGARLDPARSVHGHVIELRQVELCGSGPQGFEFWLPES